VSTKLAYFAAAALVTIISTARGVDVESPSGDKIFRVEEGNTGDEETITISFGRLDKNPENTFIIVEDPPFLEITKNGAYPLVTLCWSPKGGYCMLVLPKENIVLFRSSRQGEKKLLRRV